MAKKPELNKTNKTQAVAEYLKTHPQAKPAEITDALTKQGITITRSHVANLKSRIKHGKKKTRSRVAAVVVTATKQEPVTEKPVKQNGAITLEQIRKVAQTVKAVGGPVKLNELLEVIQDVGGLKRFKDLLAAMSAIEKDAVPF